jgi:hypothetical protein
MANIEAGQTPGTAGDPILRTGFADGQTFPLTGTIHERISQVVNARFETAEASVRGRFERFYRYEKLIAMISKRKSWDWKSNAYLPYALAATEMSAAMKVDTLVGSRPWVKVAARQAGLEDAAAHREALLDWHFMTDVDLINTAADMFRVAERYGKAIAIVAPDWDHKVLKYRAAVNIPTVYGPLARMTWKTSQERAYRIRCELMDNTDFFGQPGFRRINGRGGMKYCMRRYYLTIDDLRELEALSLWGTIVGGQAVAEIKDTQPQDLSEFKARRLFLDKYDDSDIWRDKFDRTIEIIEYQGLVPEELIDPALAQQEEQAGLNPKIRLMTLCNRKIVGINQALPWDHGMKSFVEMDSVRDPYSFWGVGKVEPIEHLVYIANEIVNMRIDNVKAAINGLIGVDGTRMPAGWKRRLVSQPWGVVETMGPPQDIIQRLQLGEVTSQSYTEQQQIFSIIQEATGINETMLGAPGGAVRTLGEHQLKQEAGGKRIAFELMVQASQLFGSSRLNPGLVYFILNLDRQYLPIPQYISVIDPMMPDEWTNLEISATDLAVDDENFVYTATGAMEGFNKSVQRMDMVQLIQTMTPFMEPAMMAGFNVIEFFKAILRTFGYDPNAYFPRMMGVVGPEQMAGPMAGPMAAMGMQGGPQPPQGRPGLQPGPRRPGGVPGGVGGQVMPFPTAGRGGA